MPMRSVKAVPEYMLAGDAEELEMQSHGLILMFRKIIEIK
jgi:hypothetical protein